MEAATGGNADAGAKGAAAGAAGEEQEMRFGRQLAHNSKKFTTLFVRLNGKVHFCGLIYFVINNFREECSR